MAIEIVSFPSYKMVDLSSSLCNSHYQRVYISHCILEWDGVSRCIPFINPHSQLIFNTYMKSNYIEYYWMGIND